MDYMPIFLFLPPTCHAIHKRDESEQRHLSHTFENTVQAQKFPYILDVSIVPSAHDSRYLRHLKYHLFLVNSLQAPLVALPASLTAGEDLLRGAFADGVEEAALSQLVGDAFVYAFLEVVDAFDAGNFCLVELV